MIDLVFFVFLIKLLIFRVSNCENFFLYWFLFFKISKYCLFDILENINLGIFYFCVEVCVYKYINISISVCYKYSYFD